MSQTCREPVESHAETGVGQSFDPENARSNRCHRLLGKTLELGRAIQTEFRKIGSRHFPTKRVPAEIPPTAKEERILIDESEFEDRKKQ